MTKNHLVYLLFPLIIISGCPNYVVEPVPSTSVPTVNPISTSKPIINDNQFNIINDALFKVEFGPGTKGVSNLGPGSKGVNGLGPGTKGVSNLKFNMNFEANLIRQDLQSFETKSSQPLYLNKVSLVLEKDGNKLANINVLPKLSQVEFTIDTNIPAGLYDLKAKVENNFEPLNAISKVELKSDFEIKVILYSETQNREDLDIAIRTRSLE